MSPSGIITTVAGTGAPGYSGDGGPATSALLNYPSGVAVDGLRKSLLRGFVDYRVRRVSPSGIIDTVAGNGIMGFSGDGGPATSAQLRYPTGLTVDAAGNLYIAGDYRIRRVSPRRHHHNRVAGNGFRATPATADSATSAQLLVARGIAVDAMGNLYIADSVKQSHPPRFDRRYHNHGGRKWNRWLLRRRRTSDLRAA